MKREILHAFIVMIILLGKVGQALLMKGQRVKLQ